MLITELGMVTLVKEVQPSNARAFISVTVSGITKLVTSSPFRYSFAPLLNGFEENPSNVIPHQDSIVPR